MKLHRFHAANNHVAILMVQDQLGPNAFIYSMHKLANGVEVVAGLPSAEDHIVDNGETTFSQNYDDQSDNDNTEKKSSS